MPPQSTHALLMLLLLGVALAPHAAWAYGTEISSTVSLFRLQEITDVECIDGQPGTRCEQMVTRAAAYGSTKINFMVTHFYQDKDNDYVPEFYCYRPDFSGDCLPFTPEIIDMWTKRFVPCLQHAVQLGFTGIAFTPHLDPTTGGWRNAMLINPLMKYGGFSYTDIMLLPLAQAMNSVMADNLTVWFALQGEMSAMVMRYPQEHQRLLPYIKSLVLHGQPDLAPSVRMGLSMNSNKLCGMEYCTAQEVAKPAYNQPAIRALYQAVDFVGISSYPKYTPGDLSTMEQSSQEHLNELKLFGIDLGQLINVQGKEFFLSEYGVGGGTTPEGGSPAQSADSVKALPFFGVSGSYTRQLDPWKNHLPGTIIVAAREYLKDWYSGAALWLSRKGGPTVRVDGVFLWALNSWDVLAIHPTSTNKEGTYRVASVAELVTSHNLQMRGRSRSSVNMNPGSLSPY